MPAASSPVPPKTPAPITEGGRGFILDRRAAYPRKPVAERTDRTDGGADKTSPTSRTIANNGTITGGAAGKINTGDGSFAGAVNSGA